MGVGKFVPDAHYADMEEDELTTSGGVETLDRAFRPRPNRWFEFYRRTKRDGTVGPWTRWSLFKLAALELLGSLVGLVAALLGYESKPIFLGEVRQKIVNTHRRKKWILDKTDDPSIRRRTFRSGLAAGKSPLLPMPPPNIVGMGGQGVA
jgi:hypothetical protein